MNMDYNHIHELVEKQEPNICEITVMKDDNIIYEDYWH